MRTSTWGLFALSSLVLATACGKSDSPRAVAADSVATLTPDQRARLGIEPVSATSFRPVVEVTGTVQFNGDRSTQIISPISGPVSQILVEPGARVTAGQALARIASPDFAENLAAYRKAAAAAGNAERIADLDQRLFERDALARRDLEQAQTDAASAVADRDAAVEQLRALGVDSASIASLGQKNAPSISQGVIRAPLAGTVVEKLITPGQLIQAGATPCFTVADLSTVWVMASVFESDLPDVAVGDSAEIRPTEGGQSFSGRVSYVAALVDPDTRATGVRVLAANPGGAFKKDMFVRVTIHTRHERTGILVPTSAVQRDEDNLPFLFVAMPDGSFARRPVQVGARLGDRYQITSGVQAGDRIITEGGLFLRFAQNQ